jgi:hypothetical protein
VPVLRNWPGARTSQRGRLLLSPARLPAHESSGHIFAAAGHSNCLPAVPWPAGDAKDGYETTSSSGLLLQSPARRRAGLAAALQRAASVGGKRRGPDRRLSSGETSVLFRYRIHPFVIRRKRLTSRESVVSTVCVVIDMLRPARGATRCSDAQTPDGQNRHQAETSCTQHFQEKDRSLTRTSHRPGWQRPTASGPLFFFNDWLASHPIRSNGGAHHSRRICRRSQSEVTPGPSQGISGTWRMHADWEFEQRLPLALPCRTENRQLN